MIIAGFGFRANATLNSLLDAYQRAGAPKVNAIATAENKACTMLFQSLADYLSVPAIRIVDIELQAAQTLTQSFASQTHRKTGSLAEASALATIGMGAVLQAPRSISQDRMATCAIAQGAPL